MILGLILVDHRHAVPCARGRIARVRAGHRWTPVSTAASSCSRWMSEGWQRASMWLPVGPRRDHPGVPRLPRVLQAPAHRHERDQRLLREHPAAGHPAPAPDRPRERRDRGRASRRGHDHRPHLEAALDLYACTECGRCQSACPAWNTGKPLSPKLLDDEPARQHVRAGPADPGGRRRARARAARSSPASIDDGGRCGLHDVRRVHRGVPGRHRAHRHDRRHAPQPGDGGVAVPDRGGALLRNLEKQGNPWGMPQRSAPSGPRALDVSGSSRSARRPPSTCTGSAARARSTTARKQISRRSSDAARAGVSFAILGPRGALHRRPRAPDGQRVPVPEAWPSRTSRRSTPPR